MRNGLRFIGLAAVAALSLTALAIQEGVVLKRAPKLGDTAKYKLNGELDFSGNEVIVTGTITDTVTNVADNGDFTLQSITSDFKANVGGTDQPLPDQTNTTVFSAANEVLSFKSDMDDPDGVRKANIQTLRFPDKPLKVGDSWTIEFKKNDKGAVDAKGMYTIEAKETVDGDETYRVKGATKESAGDNPMSAEGTYWISVKDASLVKVQGTLTNYPVPQAGGVATMKMTLVRQK